MPVWTGGQNYALFRFCPGYFKTNSDLKALTHQALVLSRNSIIPTIASPLLLDGGNVVKTTERCLITDRVLKENQSLPASKAVDSIEKTLSCELILIPELPVESTGHADGLVRFLSPTRVLLHEKTGNDRAWHRTTTRILTRRGLSIETIPFLDPRSGKDCLHINYLEAGNVILIPGVNGPIDETIEERFRRFFPGREIHTLDARRLTRHGGAFNCFTWGAGARC
jgi:agmatine deiminase